MTLVHQELRTEYEWLREHNTKVLKQSIINMEQSYKNFFKLKKGFPRFKSKHDNQSVRFPSEAISSKTFDEDSSRLNLTTIIKGLKFECSDRDKQYLYKNKELIKSLTITRAKSGKYFASILIDGDLLRTLNKPINDRVGIDLGIKNLLTLSTGEHIENPKWIKSNEKRLKHLQRLLSKKVKGSNNRNKCKIKLAKKHEKIKNQKEDYLHNITTKIVRENQIIIMEDLNVKGMMKNHKLSKSISELRLSEMRRQIEYKSLWYNRDLIFIGRFYPSSKTCSRCGHIKHNLKLSDRVYICEHCGLEIDRDDNASYNIENEGMRIYNNKIGHRLSEYKLVENPTMDDKAAKLPLKSSGLMKQENINLYNIV